VKNGAFDSADLASLRAFCRERSFDVEWIPGIGPNEANRHNVIDPSSFEDGAKALLGPDRDAFVERYKFALDPATDDRPYYFRFFRWRTLPELLALKERGGLPLLDWGYPVLVATLVQAVVLGAALILLPLAAFARVPTAPATEAPSRLRVALYFGAIGLAFMFVEIAFIQKFALFLGHPLHAVAAVLCAFLVFAGLGSRWSARFAAAGPVRQRRLVVGTISAIAGLALALLAALPSVFRLALPLPDAARLALSIALIAPLAFAMGIPFPTGLARLARGAEALIPWAWGVNACASVVAAVLATLLAIHLGFAAVILLAAALYAASTAACP
jgi:hypothetical protein